MTINDATPYPMEDPEQIGQAFGEVFDLVDETVEGVTEAEVEERLRQLLADTAEPADLDELGRVLRGQGWNVSRRLDPTTLADLTGPAAWDEAHCALQVAWEQVTAARAAADAARREAAEQIAAANAARQQAAEVTAGINAYVDAALDRAEDMLANARAEAARLVAAAEQQAEEILAAARARAVPTDVTPTAQAWPKAVDRWVVVGAPGSGKTALIAAFTTILALADDDDHCEPLVRARADVLRSDVLWRRQSTAIKTLCYPPVVKAAGSSGAMVWSDMVQHVGRLLTNQAGSPPRLVGPAADACRNTLADWNSSAQHLREALRAITADVMPSQLTGSCRRAVQVYYSSQAHELDLDLCVVLNKPDMPLVSDDGWPERGDRRERLWAMVASPGTCHDLVDLGVDVDVDGEDWPRGTGGVNQSGNARRFVVQVKQYGTAADWKLRAASTPVQPLLVLWARPGGVCDWQQALPGLDPEELRSPEQHQPVSVASPDDHGGSARSSQPEVYDFSTKE